jgi:hypothetical protein
VIHRRFFTPVEKAARTFFRGAIAAAIREIYKQPESGDESPHSKTGL